MMLSTTRESDSGTGKSFVHSEASSTTSSSVGMTDQATGREGELPDGHPVLIMEVTKEEVAPQAFEALRKSYFSLAAEHKKLGGRLRKVRAERDSYRQLAQSVMGNKDELKAMVARVTLESQAIIAERDKLKEMIDRQSMLVGKDMDSTMTESQIDVSLQSRDISIKSFNISLSLYCVSL